MPSVLGDAVIYQLSQILQKDHIAPGFSIIRDNVQFTNIVGNGGTVNRSGSQNIFFAARVNDTTKAVLVETNVTAARFWVTYDDANWDNGSGNRASNSSSYVNYTFNPECSSPRYNASVSQKWKVGLLDDGCYVDTNSSNYSLDIMGELIQTIILPNYEVYNDLENVTFIGNITSDCYDDLINDSDVTFRIYHDYFNYTFPNPANNNGTY